MTGQDRLGTVDQAQPEISVLIVNYNGGDYIRRCLASLVHQTYTNFEVIVVDNNSTDGSIDRLGELPARTRIIRETRNLGFAAGNNRAAREASGRWLALLNPDAEAFPDWLEQLLAAVNARPSHRVVASLQISMADEATLDGAGDCYLAFGYAWRGGFGKSVALTPAAGECFAPCGAAAFYPRDVFDALGGFDEAFFCYHEDVDLGFRLRLAGERCQFSPLARVRHAGSAITGRASPFAVFHGARNGVWTYTKNMPVALLIVTAPGWILLTFAILARGLITGRFASILRGLAAAFGQLPRIFKQRQLAAKSRRIGVAELARQLTWNPLYLLGRRPDVRAFPVAK
jgi:GT2 family glycosyltransferase